MISDKSRIFTRTIVLSSICFISLSFFLVGCGNFTAKNIGPTPDIENYGDYPAVREPFSPHYLNCLFVTDVSQGYTWNGITIGKTTFQEIMETRNPTVVEWDHWVGYVRFGIDDTYFGACFVGDTIVALGISPAHLLEEQRYETIYDYVDIFGPPDLITWGNFDDRTVLWAKEGIITSVLTRDDGGPGLIEGVVIISPFSPLWANQWVLDAVTAEPPVGCVFGTGEEGYTYDGDRSCCPDPFFEPDSDDCGIIEGYEPCEDCID